MLELNKVHNMDSWEGLRLLPDKLVRCTVTSPPYFGLREYGMPGQIGLEKTPEEFIEKLVRVFAEVYRVTKDDGTLWMNMGDSYSGSWGNYGGQNRGAGKQRAVTSGSRVENESWNERTKFKPAAANGISGYKKKDLMGIPWRLALALQGFAVTPFTSFSAWADELKLAREAQDWQAVEIVENKLRCVDLLTKLQATGWYLRQDIIWHKPNPMPESVTDRCTKAHEYIFLLSKSARYYFDATAIKVPAKDPEDDQRRMNTQVHENKSNPDAMKNGLRPKKVPVPSGWNTGPGSHKIHPDGRTQEPEYTPISRSGNKERKPGSARGCPEGTGSNVNGSVPWEGGMANKRDVWTVSTKPFKEAHFATYPADLIIDCIKAGSSEGGQCAECGKPLLREFDQELVPTNKASHNSQPDERDAQADDNDHGSNRIKDGHKPGWVNKTTTTGWKKSCVCAPEAGIVPDVVLDPFDGARTTMIMTRKLGRDGISFELNPKYIEIGDKRERDELGLFI